MRGEGGSADFIFSDARYWIDSVWPSVGSLFSLTLPYCCCVRVCSCASIRTSWSVCAFRHDDHVRRPEWIMVMILSTVLEPPLQTRAVCSLVFQDWVYQTQVDEDVANLPTESHSVWCSLCT